MRIRECIRKILCVATILSLAAGPALADDVSLTEMSLALGSSVVRYPAADGIADETLREAVDEKMKAGLTGYAQIEGRYNTSAEDKLMLDMMYIESFSIWLDVKLMLRTFTVLFKKDSTQGFQKSPGSNILEKNEEILKNEHNTSDHGSRSRIPVRRKQTD